MNLPSRSEASKGAESRNLWPKYLTIPIHTYYEHFSAFPLSLFVHDQTTANERAIGGGGGICISRKTKTTAKAKARATPDGIVSPKLSATRRDRTKEPFGFGAVTQQPPCGVREPSNGHDDEQRGVSLVSSMFLREEKGIAEEDILHDGHIALHHKRT